MNTAITTALLSLFTVFAAPSAGRDGDTDSARKGKRGHGNVCAKIECTDEQRSELTAIRDAMKSELADEHAAAKALRARIKAESRSANPDTDALASMRAELSELRAEFKEAREAKRAAVAKVLTPQQREALAAMKAERKGKRGKGDKAKRRKGKHAKGKHFKKVCETLECTAEQKAQIKTIRTEFKAEHADVRAAAKELRAKLKAAKTAEAPNAAEIASLEQERDALRSAMKAAKAERRAEVEAVFTPEQRAKLAEMKAKHEAKRGDQAKRGDGKRSRKGDKAKRGDGKRSDKAKRGDGKRSDKAKRGDGKRNGKRANG